MSAGAGRIEQKIKSFQKKYYLNIFIRGIILTLSILIGYLVLASLLEHNLWLSQWARLTILITFFGTAGYCVYKFLNEPLQWWLARRGINDEETAKIIGSAIPTIKDRLLNLIQLSSSKQESALTFASVEQKSREFDPIVFDRAIDLSENKRYLKYLAIPLGIVLVILIFNQSIITKSTDRIMHFNREYAPEAPFNFIVKNNGLTAFYNEDFTFKVQLTGSAVPSSAYIISKGQRLKLEHTGNGEFQYLFERIQEPIQLQVEAAGFFSDLYTIEMVNRPEMARFNVELEFPRYLQRKNERLANAGNLEIPEGTNVKWNLKTIHAERASITFFSDKSSNSVQNTGNETFTFEKKFNNPDQYEIILENDKSKNKEKIFYQIEVIKDQYPQIAVNNFKDSVLYKRVMLGGMIGDDYGVTELTLHFTVKDEDQRDITKRSIRIPISKNQVQQNFFYNWAVDSLKLKPGQHLEYYLQVFDNDGVNGRKSTKSSSYTFLVPTEENLVAQISKSQSQTQHKIDQSFNKANKLQDQIEQANQKLKGKQSLDWQDKKMLEDILQQKQGLDQIVQQLKEENKLLDEKKNAFTEQNERIKEKAQQLQKLMDELLDEETKKLFEELQKLLKENADVNQLQKLMDKLNQNTNNLEKELERTLELFKELQYEFKLDQTVQDLKKQVEEQKSLLEKTESLERENKPNGKSDKDQKGQNQKNQEQKDSNQEQNSQNENSPESLANEQEDLMQKFKETSEKMEELEKMGDELNKDEELPSEQEKEQIQQEQQQSKEQLEQKNPSKARTPQKNALQKMQQMQQKMEGMQNSMMMEMDMQNLESLRQIIHGLVKLSFDQENLMKEFNELQQNDPRFNLLAQREIKLRDDSKVLEDSLLALGKKDPMMGGFITKEIGELNNHLEKVIEANKERKRPQASSEMQMTMTSINNLALMLDDHFDMMMQMMANAKPSMKKSNQKGQKPSLSQMQQQLNQKIQDLKNSGKGGRELSEELAKMAAEQERIRRALQEMQEKMKKEGKMPGGDLPSKMEQTEMDLVNKQLTDQLIKRQKEIMTRLLDAEKSMREQNMDEERKGETAKEYEQEMPKAFEEYLRLKEKEVELLKTVPPKLYPYYKKEVSEYFKRMGTN
ncbi:DUF4175 family protein [Chryseosolibacter indicus]|uniref:DUF4175 family protein n=1 Tax=Chryseosolibacter indicus TaxID=2782351 RepID=UPI0020B3A34B|nr:DUF4175 family protein [Chryseosolibacter indicus]